MRIGETALSNIVCSSGWADATSERGTVRRAGHSQCMPDIPVNATKSCSISASVFNVPDQTWKFIGICALSKVTLASKSNIETRCTTKTVAVLLATYNGQEFIDDQLRSLQEQTHKNIDIYVSDDGSSDETLSILRKWSEIWTKGNFIISSGRRSGFAENFRYLIMTCKEGFYDGYFFCDQDDIWNVDKIERALKLTDTANGQPVIYGTRTLLVDAAGQPIGLSPLFMRPKTFQNALVQSMAGGNTMMLNAGAFAILAESARRTGFVSHDWWAYLVVTACGGRAIYDSEPSLLYRQHGGNVVGKNSGIAASVRRVFALFSGRFRDWTKQNIESLEACDDMLTPQARAYLADFKAAHHATAPFGIAALRKSGVYRQNVRGNVVLWFVCAIGRL